MTAVETDGSAYFTAVESEGDMRSGSEKPADTPDKVEAQQTAQAEAPAEKTAEPEKKKKKAPSPPAVDLDKLKPHFTQPLEPTLTVVSKSILVIKSSVTVDNLSAADTITDFFT